MSALQYFSFFDKGQWNIKKRGVKYRSEKEEKHQRLPRKNREQLRRSEQRITPSKNDRIATPANTNSESPRIQEVKEKKSNPNPTNRLSPNPNNPNTFPINALQNDFLSFL